MNKQKQVAYLTYYYTNEEGVEESETFGTLNFEEVFKFRAKAKEAEIVHKVNFTWENVSTKADNLYTVRPRKVKKDNLWRQLEKWLQS